MTAFPRRTLFALSGAGLGALALAACGAGGPEAPKEEGGVTTLEVGASPAISNTGTRAMAASARGVMLLVKPAP